MPLERADVEHIGTLARIGLTEAEVETFREQLSHILEQFEILKELDTGGVEPTGHAMQLQAVMRDDVAGDSLSAGETLSNAPQREEDFFRVKVVLEE